MTLKGSAHILAPVLRIPVLHSEQQPFASPSILRTRYSIRIRYSVLGEKGQEKRPITKTNQN